MKEAEGKAKGYSLWLMPRGEAYGKFTQLIERLAKKYNAPVFKPHVTLLGEVMWSEEDVIKRVWELVLGQRTFPITLQTVDYQNYYFRTLFVKTEITEPLLALHNRTGAIFKMQGSLPYMPHLSLLYGNFPQAVKEEIIDAIGKEQATEFLVDRIHVFKTDGEVNTWYRVKEFPFK